MHKTYKGFTIVELLIVIVIIAVLAAITIVAYTGIQNRAKASTASTALAQAKKKLELYKVDNGSYPTTGNLASAGVSNGDVDFQYTSNGTTFCITGTATNVSYKASESTAPVAGGCSGHGQGGVGAITNLAGNPSLESNVTDWAIRWFGGNGGTGTSGRVAAAAYNGNYGYRKTWSTSGNGQDIGYQFTVTGISAQQNYTFSAYTRSSVSTSYRRWVVWQDSLGTNLNTQSTGTETPIAANTWGRLSLTATAPTGASQAVFIFGPYPSSNTGYSAGDTLDADAAMVTAGSSLYNYADGNSSDWTWNGTPNNSTSTGPPL